MTNVFSVEDINDVFTRCLSALVALRVATEVEKFGTVGIGYCDSVGSNYSVTI